MKVRAYAFLFAGRPAAVDRHKHCAKPRHAEQELQVLGPVVQRDANVIAGADSMFSQKGSGGVYTSIETCVVYATATIHEGRVGGPSPRVLADRICEIQCGTFSCLRPTPS